MLERTFIHIPKIGYITEQRLWQAGIGDWSQVCSSSKAPRGFSARRWVEVQRHCEQSRQHLAVGEHRHFARGLPPRDHWRAWPDFGRSCAYLDIETTGLGRSAQVTVVGLYDGLRVQTYIAGQNLHQLAEDLERCALLVTFNGATFDLNTLTSGPTNWWRMGDGDNYPYLQDNGSAANCVFQMYNMTSADIVSDVP